MLPNTQPVEKPFKHPSGVVELHSMFFTLQGEGPFSGERSIFVRLAGCNLQCPWCDTEYTDNRQQVTPGEISDMVRALCDDRGMHTGALIVLTGGEPMRQNIAPLIYYLVQDGHRVQIESNGVLAPSAELELYLKNMPELTLVVSPKTSRINPITAKYAKAFKYVLAHGQVDPNDGLPITALGHKANGGVARPPEGWEGTIFVNPMDSHDEAENDLNMDACAGSALTHGHKMGLQIHKYLGLE